MRLDIMTCWRFMVQWCMNVLDGSTACKLLKIRLNVTLELIELSAEVH